MFPSSSRSIGFDKYASMPAAKQISRSPRMARAVMATIAMWRPVFFSIARICLVTVRPSISGICTSIKTRSNSFEASFAKASRPLLANAAWCPIFSSIRSATVWLIRLSSTSNIRKPIPIGSSFFALPGLRTAPAGAWPRAVRIADRSSGGYLESGRTPRLCGSSWGRRLSSRVTRVRPGASFAECRENSIGNRRPAGPR
jgi:hypothetical protein